MGYRSYVGFCIKVRNPESFVALLKIESDGIINQFLDNMWIDGDGLLHFEADSWKWYEDSETALARVMNLAEDYDDGYAGRYARVGEETDDVHEDAWGDDGWDLEHPYVISTIESGFSKEHSKKVIPDEVGVTT